MVSRIVQCWPRVSTRVPTARSRVSRAPSANACRASGPTSGTRQGSSAVPVPDTASAAASASASREHAEDVGDLGPVGGEHRAPVRGDGGERVGEEVGDARRWGSPPGHRRGAARPSSTWTGRERVTEPAEQVVGDVLERLADRVHDGVGGGEVEGGVRRSVADLHAVGGEHEGEAARRVEGEADAQGVDVDRRAPPRRPRWRTRWPSTGRPVAAQTPSDGSAVADPVTQVDRAELGAEPRRAGRRRPRTR